MLFCLVSLLGGGILTLAFAPFNIAPIAIVSLIVLLYSLDEQSNVKSFIIGYLWGYGFNFTSLYWIVNSLNADAEKFGWLYYPGLFLIPSVIAIYFGLMSLIFVLFTRWMENSYVKSIIFATLWFSQEFLREIFIIPWGWNHLGYSLVVSTEISQIAYFIGVKGISAVMALLSAIIFYELKKGIIITVATGVSLFVYGYIKVDSYQYEGNLPRMDIIQPNYHDISYDPVARTNDFVKTLRFIRNSIGSDIIILPEGTYPSILRADKSIHFPSNLLPKDKLVVLGADVWKFNDDQYFNSIIVVQGGNVKSHYFKQILVPFGEYFPGSSLLPSLFKKIARGMGEFSSGSGSKIIKIGKYKALASICYEGVFPMHFYEDGKDADFILNISNDAWFGDSIGIYQHFAMLRMRAIEAGLPIIRGTVNGISAIIDPLGRVKSSLPLRLESEDIEVLRFDAFN